MQDLNSRVKLEQKIRRIVTREKTRDGLLNGVCSALTEYSGYYRVWIMLQNKSGTIGNVAESVLSGHSTHLAEWLRNGQLPYCCRHLVENGEKTLYRHAEGFCGDCPLSVDNKKTAGLMTIRIEDENRVYGFMVALQPPDRVNDRQDQEVLEDIADDIAWALSDIESREEYSRYFNQMTIKAQLLDSVTDMIVVRDRIGQIVYVNETVYEMLGYKKSEILGQNVSKLVIPEEQGHLEERFDEIIRTGKYRYESVAVKKNGERLYLESHIRPIKWEGETMALAVLRDITRRKKAEDALRESEAKFRTLVESIPHHVFIKDVNSRFVFCNPSMAETYGTDYKEMIGKTDFDYFPEDVARRLLEEDQQLLQSATLQDVPEEQIVFNGEERFLHTVKTPITDDAGAVSGMLGISWDITEKRNAEKQLKDALVKLERSNAELEQFAYVASHDLQEPLRMVASYTQLLARRYSERLDGDALEFIGYAVDGAHRMQQLINDLLTYSRVNTRGKPFSAINMESVVDDVLMNLRIAIEESGAEITRSPLPELVADETQMCQLLQNLVANAIKFRGDEKPHIHIEANRNDGDWKISVRDNGIGIEKQYYERIFLIFQRLHGKNEYPGTGIGLAVCKRIVQRHGGEIWIESEPGKGSVFHFTIPSLKKEME